MNLDLGGTIWLNPSRKLLSFHRWFFVKFEDMPKKVYEEFKHHSHTHTNSTVNSSSDGHIHSEFTNLTDCGASGATSHDHRIFTDIADAHGHNFVTVSFLSANLGSPNWYAHVHQVDVVVPSAGAIHLHAVSATVTEYDFCERWGCVDAMHRHGKGTLGSSQNGGGSHTHTETAQQTNWANQADTPENHRHSFFIYLDYGNSHSHTFVAANAAAATCAGGKSHVHSWKTTSEVATHNHSCEGNSGYGGEALPVAVIFVGGTVQQAKLQDII